MFYDHMFFIITGTLAKKQTNKKNKQKNPYAIFEVACYTISMF